ncbi:MAG: DUF4278 domain-containing protein [Cyanobacteria bacterium J06598_1]
MKLTYRGIEYDYNPPMLEVTESEMTCQYRGARTAYTYVRHVPIPQPAERLSYRGVAYQTTRQGQIQQLSEGMQVATQQATRQQSPLSNLRSKLAGTSDAAQARRELLKESSKLHQKSITRSLEHRIEVSRAQGNQRLIDQLESEMRQAV